MAWSTFLGIVIGALPGLTATMGVALMTTLTYKLAADLAILILMCVYVGAIYGGSRTAILINIPGTPANAATTLDGFPLAKQGLAGRAMGVATSGSVLGQHHRHVLPGHAGPAPGQLCPQVPVLRVLLAGHLRDRHLGSPHRPARIPSRAGSPVSSV